MKGIVCGKGGQGVITLNRLIGETLSKIGYSVISAETHGMAMRGGSVNTFLKIGNYKSASFSIGEADFLISTDVNEYFLYKGYLSDGKNAIVNSEEVHKGIICIDATKKSIELFSTPKMANWFLFILFFSKFYEGKFDKVLEVMLTDFNFDNKKLDKIIKEVDDV